jgi:hypothetical protein
MYKPKHKHGLFHKWKRISDWKYIRTDGATSMREFSALFQCSKCKKIKNRKAWD